MEEGIYRKVVGFNLCGGFAGDELIWLSEEKPVVTKELKFPKSPEKTDYLHHRLYHASSYVMWLGCLHEYVI